MKKEYTINYACACTLGKLRKNNEDNFYCDKRIRFEPDNKDDILFHGSTLSKNNDMFAVFDGMGGEACGEVASFTAAKMCFDFNNTKTTKKEYLCELSEMLNNKIKDETVARSIVLMGTTAAMIQFSKSEIYILNSGDSRIFKLTGDNLTQISKDHTVQGFGGKSPLTNFLGVPAERFTPYVARGSYKENDVFLLCTDGITDMIPIETLRQILYTLNSQNQPLEYIAQHLISLANHNGGCDNATLILCKIC